MHVQPISLTLAISPRNLTLSHITWNRFSLTTCGHVAHNSHRQNLHWLLGLSLFSRSPPPVPPSSPPPPLPFLFLSLPTSPSTWWRIGRGCLHAGWARQCCWCAAQPHWGAPDGGRPLVRHAAGEPRRRRPSSTPLCDLLRDWKVLIWLEGRWIAYLEILQTH